MVFDVRTGGRSALAVAAIVVGWVGVPVALSGQGASSLRGMFGAAQVTIADSELSTPVDYAVFRDGSVVVAQYPDARVAKYSATGTLLWRVGREGSGPGEFRQPHRLCVLPDESVLVFDVFGNVWTLLGPDGAFKRTLRPDLEVRKPGAVLCAPDGSVLVSGVTSDSRGRRFAIHQFSESLQHQRSFGELPSVTDQRLLHYIGAGTLASGDAQSFYHVRSAPYELVRYSWSGALQSRVRVPIVADAPETWQTFGPGSVRTNKEARRPHSVTRLSPNRFLGGIGGTAAEQVLFDSTGTALDKGRRPADWKSIAAYDPRAAMLWVYREPDDVPEVVRIPVRVR